MFEKGQRVVRVNSHHSYGTKPGDKGTVIQDKGRSSLVSWDNGKKHHSYNELLRAIIVNNKEAASMLDKEY
jgi:hypothetical protein